jgi:hypothetical protein
LEVYSKWPRWVHQLVHSKTYFYQRLVQCNRDLKSTILEILGTKGWNKTKNNLQVHHLNYEKIPSLKFPFLPLCKNFGTHFSRLFCCKKIIFGLKIFRKTRSKIFPQGQKCKFGWRVLGGGEFSWITVPENENLNCTVTLLVHYPSCTLKDWTSFMFKWEMVDKVDMAYVRREEDSQLNKQSVLQTQLPLDAI